MCVSGVRSGAVSCERVCVSCEWASRRSSVVRREVFSFALCCVSCEIPKFSCRVLNSSFSCEFVVEFSIRISSSSSLNFRVEFRIRFFRFVALFDFSKSIVKFDFSNFNFRFEFRIRILEVVFWSRILNSSFSFRCSIRLLEVRCSSRFLEFRVLDSSALNFEFVFFVVLIYSTSRISICESSFEFVVEISIQNCRRNLCCSSRILHLSSSSNFATFVARRLKSPIFVLNCELTSSIILARSPSLRSRCHASFARAFRA